MKLNICAPLLMVAPLSALSLPIIRRTIDNRHAISARDIIMEKITEISAKIDVQERLWDRGFDVLAPRTDDDPPPPSDGKSVAWGQNTFRSDSGLGEGTRGGPPVGWQPPMLDQYGRPYPHSGSGPNQWPMHPSPHTGSGLGVSTRGPTSNQLPMPVLYRHPNRPPAAHAAPAWPMPIQPYRGQAVVPYQPLTTAGGNVYSHGPTGGIIPAEYSVQQAGHWPTAPFGSQPPPLPPSWYGATGPGPMPVPSIPPSRGPPLAHLPPGPPPGMHGSNGDPYFVDEFGRRVYMAPNSARYIIGPDGTRQYLGVDRPRILPAPFQRSR